MLQSTRNLKVIFRVLLILFIFDLSIRIFCFANDIIIFVSLIICGGVERRLRSVYDAGSLLYFNINVKNPKLLAKSTALLFLNIGIWKNIFLLWLVTWKTIHFLIILLTRYFWIYIKRNIPFVLCIFSPYSQSLHKKWSFPLKISSANVTKSAVSWGFGHIYWRNS